MGSDFIFKFSFDFDFVNLLWFWWTPLTSIDVLLQAGASMMDPNHFLMIVLSRFELFHIFSSADIRKRYRETNKVSAEPADVLLMSEGHI